MRFKLDFGQCDILLNCPFLGMLTSRNWIIFPQNVYTHPMLTGIKHIYFHHESFKNAFTILQNNGNL